MISRSKQRKRKKIHSEIHSTVYSPKKCVRASLFPFFKFQERERERERSRLFQIVFTSSKKEASLLLFSPRGGKRTILTPSNALCQFKVRRGTETGRREEEITNATRREKEKGGRSNGKETRAKARERETVEKRNGFFWRPSPTGAKEGSVLRAPILPPSPPLSHHDEWWPG